MSQSNPLVISGTVTLDGSGNGFVRLGPSAGTRWELNSAGVIVGGNPVVLIPQLRLYVGPTAAQEWYVDGTFVGSLNSSTNVAGHTVTPGNYVWAVWTGGDVGASATLTLRGNIITGVGR